MSPVVALQSDIKFIIIIIVVVVVVLGVTSDVIQHKWQVMHKQFRQHGSYVKYLNLCIKSDRS